jgi:hypothetical protein
MTRMYKAVCQRDTVQDNPYQYFKAGFEYVIPEDCPVATHFKPVEQLSKKESEKIAEEGPPPAINRKKQSK